MQEFAMQGPDNDAWVVIKTPDTVVLFLGSSVATGDHISIIC